MLATQPAPTRSDLIDDFLRHHGFGAMQRNPLKGDASFRRYERLVAPERSLMLMDAPPPQEDVRPFIAVTSLLRGYGFSAPQILAQNETHGFLVLEDFGLDSYSSLLKSTPAREHDLYLEATELQVELYHASRGHSSGLAPYDRAVQMREIALLSDWFLPQVVGIEAAQSLKPSYLQAWEQVLDATSLHEDTPVLRDYHADNLMWLADREGTKRVGLLDYQDALLGDAAYDLVSFLEDIRRNVSPTVIEACLGHFIKGTKQSPEGFRRRYAVLGAQRNTKIVGIFTRLCVRDGKAHYLDFLPQVWAWLERDVDHEALAPVKHWLDRHVPREHRGAIAANPSLGSFA